MTYTIRRLRKLAEAATPGPWKIEDTDISEWIVGPKEQHVVGERRGEYDIDESQNLSDDDRAFIVAARNHIIELLDLLGMARSYAVKPGHDANHPIMVEWRGGVTWCVSYIGHVLNRDGQWEYEPFPSNREDAFLSRTRFSLEEALMLAKEAKL